jgi:hypothetical protein
MGQMDTDLVRPVSIRRRSKATGGSALGHASTLRKIVRAGRPSLSTRTRRSPSPVTYVVNDS